MCLALGRPAQGEVSGHDQEGDVTGEEAQRFGSPSRRRREAIGWTLPRRELDDHFDFDWDAKWESSHSHG